MGVSLPRQLHDQKLLIDYKKLSVNIDPIVEVRYKKLFILNNVIIPF